MTIFLTIIKARTERELSEESLKEIKEKIISQITKEKPYTTPSLDFFYEHSSQVIEDEYTGDTFEKVTTTLYIFTVFNVIAIDEIPTILKTLCQAINKEDISIEDIKVYKLLKGI